LKEDGPLKRLVFQFDLPATLRVAPPATLRVAMRAGMRAGIINLKFEIPAAFFFVEVFCLLSY
jgi:hypothetical protein